MATATNVNNSLVKQNGNGKPPVFSVYLNQESTKKWLNNMIGGDTARSQRFMTAVISVVSNNPALAKCDHVSIITAALAGEALKLSPAPQMGQYYMVPFNDKYKGATAVFVLGYKGYIQLAIRSGYYRKLNVLAIKDGELVYFDPLTEDIEINLINDDTVREAAETTGYYAMFEYQNGFRKAMYWSKEKMLAHADKYSPAFKAEKYQQLLSGKISQSEAWKYSSFWYKDFDGMAYKTMLRQLISKWGIMSIEMQDAYSKDNHAITANMEPEYISGVDEHNEALPSPSETQTTADDSNKPASEDDPFLSNDDLPEPGTDEYAEMSRRADLEAEMESAV